MDWKLIHSYILKLFPGKFLNVTLFNDDFLQALEQWQCGWHEDATKRKTITDKLLSAIENSSLPPLAFEVPEFCYRKRFLVPNNPEGDDLIPPLVEGIVKEGVSSWTTNYEYCKLFKARLRPGTFQAIFRTRPKREQVVLNIEALWRDVDFISAVIDFVKRQGSHVSALEHFKDSQSEIILDAPLLKEDLFGFCEKTPSFDQIKNLLKEAGFDQANDDDVVAHLMEKNNIISGANFWIEGETAQGTIYRVVQGLLRKQSPE